MIPHTVYEAPITIEEVAPDSPAEAAGIQVGDTILALNGETLNNSGDLQRLIQINLGEVVTLTVKHTDGSTETLEVMTRWRPPEGQGASGIRMAPIT